MRLIDQLKEKLERKVSKIKVRGTISGGNVAEIRMTNIKEEPITLGTPVDNVKMGIQILQPSISGAVGTFPEGYRIDNSHGSIHQHSGATISTIKDKTVSGALFILFSNYHELEETIPNP